MLPLTWVGSSVGGTISGHWNQERSEWGERKRKFGPYALKRVAAGAHLPTPWLFELAKRPHDRADYCFDCSFLPKWKQLVLVLTLEWSGARSMGEQCVTPVNDKACDTSATRMELVIWVTNLFICTTDVWHVETRDKSHDKVLKLEAEFRTQGLPIVGTKICWFDVIRKRNNIWRAIFARQFILSIGTLCLFTSTNHNKPHLWRGHFRWHKDVVRHLYKRVVSTSSYCQ